MIAEDKRGITTEPSAIGPMSASFDGEELQCEFELPSSRGSPQCGQTMRKWSFRALMLIPLVSTMDAESRAWDDPERWIQEHDGGQKYREMGDEALKVKFARFLDDADGTDDKTRHEFDSVLMEVSRRKPADWEGVLERAVKEVRKVRKGESEFERQFNVRDLEILTVLRRLQGKPQPLALGFNPLPGVKWDFPALPVLEVSARRHPDEAEDFRFTFGGDYRTGRQSRWTVLVWNSRGELLPRRGRMGMMGGGIFKRDTIGDQVWESTLSLKSFLEDPVPPGRYWGRLAYHDEVSIADVSELGGYVLSYSPPFEFEVGPRAVEELTIGADVIRKLIHALPADGEVKILSATYSKGAHGFIGPGSPAGKLLELSWPVVPALVRHLADPGLTPTQRAWGFGILHSITSIKEPTQREGVVGPFAMQSGGFWIANKTNGDFSGAGGGFGGTSTSSGGKIDAAVQQEFLKEWQTLVPSLIVSQAKDRAAAAPAAQEAEAEQEGDPKPEC